jgi:hypothetical protein
MSANEGCTDMCGAMFSRASDFASSVVDNPWIRENVIEPASRARAAGVKMYISLGLKIEQMLPSSWSSDARRITSLAMRIFPLSLALSFMSGPALAAGTFVSAIALFSFAHFNFSEDYLLYGLSIPLSALSMASVRYLALSFINPYCLIPAALCALPPIGMGIFLGLD